MDDLRSYVCSGCDASGYKLWRNIFDFGCSARLLCASCAAEKEEVNIDKLKDDGIFFLECGLQTDQIGSFVPAIPMRKSGGYWNTSLFPNMDWWNKLPTTAIL